MKQVLSLSTLLVLFLVGGFFVSQQNDFTTMFTLYIQNGHLFASYLTYIVILVVSVVLMPLSSMPLIPIMTSIAGPFITGILNVIGWTIGAIIAFWIARVCRKSFLGKFTSLEKIDALVETIPKKSLFLFVLLLRLTLPVDITSYALGLTKSLGFLEYFVATFIGVLWFSFAFAYLGDALINGNILLFIQISSASLVIFLIGWYLLRRSRNSK